MMFSLRFPLYDNQLPAYLSPDKCDFEAIACNAFNNKWHPRVAFYANPPWSLIDLVLQKTEAEGATVLVVNPEWTDHPWFPMLENMTLRTMTWSQPLYLDKRGHIRPAQKWKTSFSVVSGSKVV